MFNSMAAKKKVRKARVGQMRLTAAVTREGRLYVAQCLEVDVASQGETVETALENLREALELYLEDSRAEAPRAAPIIAPVDVTLG